LIPAAYLLLCDLTCRLGTQADDERDQTRRAIAKLAIHFWPFINDGARLHAEASVTRFLATANDDRLAWECLAACARVDHDERKHQDLMDKLRSLEEIHAKSEALLRKMEVLNG
jgi:hypothetical protein